MPPLPQEHAAHCPGIGLIPSASLIVRLLLYSVPLLCTSTRRHHTPRPTVGCVPGSCGVPQVPRQCISTHTIAYPQVQPPTLCHGAVTAKCHTAAISHMGVVGVGPTVLPIRRLAGWVWRHDRDHLPRCMTDGILATLGSAGGSVPMTGTVGHGVNGEFIETDTTGDGSAVVPHSVPSQPHGAVIWGRFANTDSGRVQCGRARQFWPANHIRPERQHGCTTYLDLEHAVAPP
jgi:hypothetical protein